MNTNDYIDRNGDHIVQDINLREVEHRVEFLCKLDELADYENEPDYVRIELFKYAEYCENREDKRDFDKQIAKLCDQCRHLIDRHPKQFGFCVLLIRMIAGEEEKDKEDIKNIAKFLHEDISNL